MYVLKREDLADFIESLRDYFPFSLPIYCQSRNILRRKCDWPGTEVVVDQYPNYSVCLTRPIPGSEEYVPRPRVWQQHISFFTKTAEALELILNEQDIVDWYRPICFSAVPSVYVPVVVKRAETFGHTRGTEDSTRNLSYILRPEDLDAGKQPLLPAGCQIGHLEIQRVHEVLREGNRFRGHGADNEDGAPYMRYVVTHGFPTSAIFCEKNELIAYCIYSPNGGISHGFVREDWRGRSLFQLVCRALAEKIFSELDQDITWGRVNAANEAAKKSFIKTGAKLAADWDTQMLEYIPYM